MSAALERYQKEQAFHELRMAIAIDRRCPLRYLFGENHMEKLGVAKQDLLNELKSQYQALKEQEANLIKTGSPASELPDLSAVKAKIDELESTE